MTRSQMTLESVARFKSGAAIAASERGFSRMTTQMLLGRDENGNAFEIEAFVSKSARPEIL